MLASKKGFAIRNGEQISTIGYEKGAKTTEIIIIINKQNRYTKSRNTKMQLKKDKATIQANKTILINHTGNTNGRILKVLIRAFTSTEGTCK